MPYREKKIYSGKILEVEVYPISCKERKQSRKKKEKRTSLKQKNLNDKNARKHFARLVNNNFTDNDIVAHLTYTDKELPENEEEAKRDITNYIRRIKHYRNKHGLPEMKYMAVIEVGEKGKRLHHHIIMSGDIDRDTVEKLWGKGRANADRLKADENGYEALAKYMTKSQKVTKDTKGTKGNKRWIQSRNLKQPVIKVNDFKYTKKKVHEISTSPEDKEIFRKEYPEYFLNECKVTENQIMGGTYLYIKMRKLKD
ncbi:hypothetical protein AGR56_09015 [Clostridium sp. DMHC 10]|uniref:rolling circle replication-associated protein n=1 Tax=Clostridium sp. DMHC 10 TaxID=747377 RepID=UPI00069D4592|nr:hypothetical protein [Clostridium sp. DMHC 10]KOF56796.1 hypothetical protein AGR56_09015 [Clostridium sp. DMHC 10]